MYGEDPVTCPLSPLSDRRSSSRDTVNSRSPFSSTLSHVAMAKLEDDFRNILVAKSNDVLNSLIGLTSSLLIDRRSCDGEYSEEGDQSSHELGGDSSTGSSISRRSIKEIDLFSLDSVAELRSIADQMISNGYGREIVQVYCSVRKSAIDLNLKNLGVEKLSIGDVEKLKWVVIENKIRRWICAAKVCVRIIFASENKLCNSIFELDEHNKNSNNTTNINPFLDTVKGAALQLFGFPDAISIGRRSPEKIFKILDLHDAISELLPDVAEVFGSKACEAIHSHVSEILARLVEAVRGILPEFENAVLNDPSTVPVPGGTVHSLTRYVMNYIKLLSDYKQTLTELIVNKPSGMAKLIGDNPNAGGGGVLDIGFSEMENQPPLALHMIWTIAILQFNLVSKANLYKDSSLAHFFMMNNVYKIVHKVKISDELRKLISDDYLRKLTRKFTQYAMSYERATWGGILDCLKEEGIHVTGSFSSRVSKSILRERFKSFNALFHEAHKTQATWCVPDVQLREELRISISEKLLSAYRSFLGRFRHHIENGRHPEIYIRYSVDDIDKALIDFFEGVKGDCWRYKETGRRMITNTHMLTYLLEQKPHV